MPNFVTRSHLSWSQNLHDIFILFHLQGQRCENRSCNFPLRLYKIINKVKIVLLEITSRIL